jgi:hypothetical protein
MAVIFLKIQISMALTNLLYELGGLWTAGRPLGNNPHERSVAVGDKWPIPVEIRGLNRYARNRSIRR